MQDALQIKCKPLWSDTKSRDQHWFGAEFATVWPDFLLVGVLGAAFLAASLLTFRRAVAGM